MRDDYVVPERDFFVASGVATRFAQEAPLHEGWSELGVTGKRCGWCHQTFVGFAEGIPDHLCSGPADPSTARELEEELHHPAPKILEPW